MVKSNVAEERLSRILLTNIKVGKVRMNVENDVLAAAALMATSTLYSRYRKPTEFTLRELLLISHKLGMPLTKLLSEQEG